MPINNTEGTQVHKRSVLFIVIDTPREIDLQYIINNINSQKNIHQKIAIITKGQINLGLSNENSNNTFIYGSNNEDLNSLINSIIIESSEEYVSFWFKGQWSHTSRIIYQIENMERTHKAISVLNYTLMYEKNLKMAAVSPRFLNFTSSLWKKNYLLELGCTGISLATGKTLDVSGDILKRISPVTLPYLLIIFDEDQSQSRDARYEYIWDSFIPVSDNLLNLINGIERIDVYTDGLSKALEIPKAIENIEYAFTRGEILL
ncbi:hypothetical protein [Cellvibrio mixtus]|uniref:hypothetical protein n=1 Tax=Cellvibrio mixtus TaxID=39650 RepID=UPI000586D577|nr:hypothetical protein [Cellvibrio mixtus]